MRHSSVYNCQCALAIFYPITVPSTIQQLFTYKIFRVLFRIFLLFLCLGDWRSASAQQHLPSATVSDPEKQPSQLGKNHLNGIRRLSVASQEDVAWEHRHLRHISFPMQIKSPHTMNNQIVTNGGAELMRPPIAQRLPEIPRPVLEEVNEQAIFDLSSTEAEALAKKLLQNAGMEQELVPKDKQQQQVTHVQRTSWYNKGSSAEKKNKLSRPSLSSPLLHSEEDDPNLLDGEGRKTMERIKSRWPKIGPLLKTNTSSLIPLRRLRLVQHRRKLQKDSRQRLQSKVFVPLPFSPTPQHTATAERATNMLKSVEITTKSSLITNPNNITKNSMAPRARQLAAGYPAEQHRIANEFGQRQQKLELDKDNDHHFDIESTKVALLEVQQRQQQLIKQHPKGWEPAERMLRHRHRIRFEQQQHRQRQRRPPIFNGTLLSGVVEDGSSVNGQKRQYGLKTELREGQRGNRLEELLAEEEQLTRPEDSILAKSTEPHNNRRPVQVERRFRLVPNKVIFRPRLKIRRPPAGHPESIVANSGTVARGTDKQNGQQPIEIPSLSTFQSAPDSIVQPILIPPALEEPPLRLASPSPSMTATIESIATPPPPSPKTPIPPSLQPLPALEIGSIGEQPPQNIQGGPLTMPSPETTTTTTQVPKSTQRTPENVGSNVLMGETAGSGLIGNSPETDILPSGFSDGSGFIGGAGGGDNGLAFGADLGTPPLGFKEAFGLNGFETSIGSFGVETTTTFSSSTIITQPSNISTTQIQTTTTQLLTTTSPMPPSTTTTKITSPVPPPLVEEVFIIPENSGLRPVSPPKEFQGSGGFGSHGTVVSSSGGGGNGFGGGGGGRIPEPPPPNAQVEPPQQPLKPEDFFTGESAFQPNKRGPEGDGYGPSVLPGAPIPPAPAGPAIGVGGAAAGIPLPPFRPLPNAIGGGAAAPEQPIENEATTVKPSALLNFLNKADEGFNQVITHFERGTPLEAAAIDIMEVALGSQKLDSQAKLLSHVDRAIGLDNLQRLQRWANTGGAFDLIKEQFAKIAKNYKPPPETSNLFTVPPQLEYLFQPAGGSSSSGKRRKRR